VEPAKWYFSSCLWSQRVHDMLRDWSHRWPCRKNRGIYLSNVSLAEIDGLFCSRKGASHGWLHPDLLYWTVMVTMCVFQLSAAKVWDWTVPVVFRRDWLKQSPWSPWRMLHRL
jgi:hypothetical protein